MVVNHRTTGYFINRPAPLFFLYLKLRHKPVALPIHSVLTFRYCIRSQFSPILVCQIAGIYISTQPYNILQPGHQTTQRRQIRHLNTDVKLTSALCYLL